MFKVPARDNEVARPLARQAGTAGESETNTRGKGQQRLSEHERLSITDTPPLMAMAESTPVECVRRGKRETPGDGHREFGALICEERAAHQETNADQGETKHHWRLPSARPDQCDGRDRHGGGEKGQMNPLGLRPGSQNRQERRRDRRGETVRQADPPLKRPEA
jgi:hypothetical protein